MAEITEVVISLAAQSRALFRKRVYDFRRIPCYKRARMAVY